MTRQEEILTLRKYPRHYLWHKPRKDWTDEDIENLKNGVTKHNGSTNKVNYAKHKTKVLVIQNKEKKSFDSVVAASKHLNFDYGKLVNIINNKMKQKEDFQIYKF